MQKQYTYNKLKDDLCDAILYLATANGDMRDRLKYIFLGGALYTVETIQFPNELKSKWNQIEKHLTKYPETYGPKGDINVGSIEVTLGKIQNKTACKIATLIVELHEEISDFVN